MPRKGRHKMKSRVGCFLFFVLFMPVVFSTGCKSTKPTAKVHAAPVAQKKWNARQVFPEVTIIPDGGVIHEITLWENIPFVEVYINGKGPFVFAVDTGSSLLMISSRLAAPLGLTISTRSIHLAVGTAGGESNFGYPRKVKTVSIGNAVFQQMDAALIPDSALSGYPTKFDGVLGLALFRDCVMELDYVEKHLKLAALDDPSAAISEDVVPAVFTRTGIKIEGVFDNKAFSFSLDTGSPYGISLSREHESDLKFKSGGRKWTTLRTLRRSVNVEICTLDGNAAFGNLVLKEPPMYLYTMNLIGSRVLKDCILRINQNQKRVSITQK
jgi:hypothetical protein